MDNHKFSVGQQVSVAIRDKGLRNLNAEITRLLPFEGPELQYRVRCRTETHERVVAEGMLLTAT